MNDDTWEKIGKWISWLLKAYTIAYLIWHAPRLVPWLLQPKVLLHTVVTTWIGTKVGGVLFKRLNETDNRFTVIIMFGFMIVWSFSIWLTGRWLGIY